MIKHIVLAAGSYKGLHILGALKYLASIDFYNMENIETIHGGSVGGLIGALLCLQIDWEDIIKYIIDRPWNKLIKLDSNALLSFVTEKGLFDDTLIKAFFKNLLESKGLKTEITLLEFYEFSNIKLYLHTVNVNTLHIRHLSHETEPDMLLIDAINHSCCIPFVFKPKKIEGEFYIDGAVKNHYPLNFCVEKGFDKDEILGIKIKDDKYKNNITENDNLFKYTFSLFTSLISEYRTKCEIEIKNEIIIPTSRSNVETAMEVMAKKEKRQEFLELGERYAKLFLSYQKKK
jgi:predicted acylesterase/phospholipase RssA